MSPLGFNLASNAFINRAFLSLEPKPNAVPFPQLPGQGNVNPKAMPQATAASSFSRLPVDQLRSINSKVEINDKSQFKMSDALKYMFDINGYTKLDPKTNDTITAKPLNLGGKVILPVGTVISNRSDYPDGNAYAQPSELKFTTPNGKSFTFSENQDRKTGQRLTEIVMNDSKSKKSALFVGAPFFNAKTGTLTTASNTARSQAVLFNNLIGSLDSAVKIDRQGFRLEEGTVKASARDINNFFMGLNK